MSRACADGDLLTCEELLLVVASHEELPAIVSSSSDAAILAAFVSMGGSSDRSGHVDTGRIRSVINEVGLTIGIDELLSLLDTDQSGSIEYDEFKCLFEEEEDTVSSEAKTCADRQRRKRQADMATCAHIFASHSSHVCIECLSFS